MSRCPHCKKLTHSEDLYAQIELSDIDKVHELMSLDNWASAWEYVDDLINTSEYGKLKCGDIYIHFLIKPSK